MIHKYMYVVRACKKRVIPSKRAAEQYITVHFVSQEIEICSRKGLKLNEICDEGRLE